ncbi:UPF0764 protein C16orf89 homolog [Anneissia japonica]|uniref:UPF0764 protein C16orf89 homolog n=1 Tax=Anneissia japonica TaxID=1529436 RepID=UPI0014256EDD|nr:UPF0764 protein C16orf89 homolog [Anneissia japonica]
MASRIFMLACTLMLISINASSSSDLDRNCAQNEENLGRIIKSLQTALLFLGNEYNTVNLDVISGLRMTQAEIAAAIESMSYIGSGTNLQTTIQGISTRIDEIVTLAQPFVYKALPAYYEHFSDLIKKDFWNVKRQHNVLTENPILFGIKNKGELTEEASDECLTELLGTGHSRKQCTVTRACLDIMEADGYTGYEVTHQLLYFMLIDHLQCLSYDLTRQRNRQVITGLCSRIYQQADELAKTDFSGRYDHDMFMEQIAFCGGLLGYDEFMRSDWLNHILSWQLDSGCFSVVNILTSDGGYGCFGHCTAVAVITLGGYLRTTIERMNNCIE